MKHYIGIDLGTTNSAICSFDGQNVRIWKSPEQNDVTPSAIYVNKRGNRYYGLNAYNQAPHDPDNSATLFKRFMGTSHKISIKSADLSLTPEECSAEILKVLYGYLPEEIRNSDETATIITVPAAFNQMKKNATLQAANLAGINNVALMQEPVAAIMSIMKNSKQEGIFVVYDLGGGTFDVSIAENIGGKVNLLAHGGIEMCGGRDFDRMIFDQIVVPWLRSNFELDDDFICNDKYKTLCRLAQWAAERAKIELSAKDDSIIALGENDVRCADLKGNDIYIDISIKREQIDSLVYNRIVDTIEATRETISKAGLTSNDIEKIVFVGGPTNYKPLRDKVSFELALPANIDVNPMTAVAEGASIFAESIDWGSNSHNRKSVNAEVKSDSDISFRYVERTSDSKAKILFRTNNADGYSVEITSLNSGWTSGRADLKDGIVLDLPLPAQGENVFDITVYNSYGQKVQIGSGQIIITKTHATIGAIPASHSIGVEVIDKIGGTSALVHLVKEGDSLPKKGQEKFRAGQTLKAGTPSSINFKLWEGPIEYPITDNRFIGVMKIIGTDFDSGVITTGAEIICDYEVSDSGAINLELSVPSIGATFKNSYSRQEAQSDLSNIDKIADDGQRLISRIDEILEKVNDEKLMRAREKAESVSFINSESVEAEDAQAAANEVYEAKKLLAYARQEHLKEIRQMDLSVCVEFFDDNVREFARQTETGSFENLAKAAQRSIARNDNDFENQLHELRHKNFLILYRQDWFIIDWFNRMVSNPYNFIDLPRFEELRKIGQGFIKNDKIDELRAVIAELYDIQIIETAEETMFDDNANIVKG